MKTAKLGIVLLVVALLLSVGSYFLLSERRIDMAALLMICSFVSMVAALGLITFDKRWAKERHETEEYENDD